MAADALEGTVDTGESGINLGGRPTVYRQEFNRQARRLALLGATDADIAEFFQVSEVTINAWKQTHPKFLKSLNSGKINADAHIAERLYKRAAGYSCPDTKVLVVDGAIEHVELTKHYPPDTGAAKLWLTNRRPDLWRDRSNVDITSNGQSIAELAAAAYARAEIKRQERDRIADIPAPAQIDG